MKRFEDLSEEEVKRVFATGSVYVIQGDPAEVQLHAKLDRIIELLEKGPTVSVNTIEEGFRSVGVFESTK